MIDRRLAVLQAIARHGTVTAAAEVCRLTPSAVSHQMQTLARELDVVLLEPAGRGVRLTAAAHTVLSHAEALSQRWEQARADLAAHRDDTLDGTLRLCAFSTAAAVVAPRAMALLRRAHPSLRVRLRETEPIPSFDRLAARDCDIAVVVATPGIPARTETAFEQAALYSEPLDLLVGPEHRLAGAEEVSLLDVAAEEWVVGSPGSAYHQLVTLACTGSGFEPVVAHHADSWDAGAALVAHGLCVALVPRLVDLPAHQQTRRIPLTGPSVPTRHVLTAVRAGSSDQPVVRAGLEAIREVRRAHLPELRTED